MNKEDSKLLKLLSVLEAENNDHGYNYVVPDLWNAWSYNGEEKQFLPNGEIIVNPYSFYASVIKDYILPQAKKDKNYSQSLSQIKQAKHAASYKGGDWVKKSVLYSTMVRTSTSWDHDRNGKIDDTNVYHLKETGTFVKSLALLPLLKKMGVDVVYLLPISKFSLKDKKGELGSPYGVSNIFEIDPNLKDPITKDHMTVDEEFQAFVEAVHILDMRITIDIIPRTNAVENDLIIDHPDWFYWINAKDMPKYHTPHVEGVGDCKSPLPEYMPFVYKSPEVLKHIALFQKNPLEADPAKWKELKKEYNKKSNQKSICELIEEYYGLKVAPAFSDCINDPQPPWTDVTFFRMFLDNPELTADLAPKDANPYILFDTIKSNIFQGKKPNQGLWDTLSDIVPYYQRHYGIDGARIDMGHALPSKLLDQIISKAREIDPDFCFIAEELNPDNAPKAKENGYNCIIGNGFMMETRLWDPKLKEFMLGTANLALPSFACGETHDTPRLAARDGGRNFAKMLAVMNMFVPNGIPFINSGQEVYETQPMNTGLDCRPNEAYMLDPSDPYYGKLALFDKFAIHYLNHMRWDIPDNLEKVKNIRNEYLTTITNVKNYMPVNFENNNTFGFAYKLPNKQILLIVANANPYEPSSTKALVYDLRKKCKNDSIVGELLYGMHERGARRFLEFDEWKNPYFFMGPGEVKVIKF